MKAFVLFSFLFVLHAHAQKLPSEMHFSADGKRLISGDIPSDGFYQLDKIRTLHLQFDQPNYWSLLMSNYQSKTDLPATLTYDGKSYQNVGVRFKGQTSYQRVSTQKKSFNITLDFSDKTQNIKGYETLNLNNSFEDNSFMREVFYENITRPFSPSLKANYVHLFINGQDWGLYPNVQALDGTYEKEWFLSNDGTRWRCERSSGGGGPGGFGAGTSTLNYLGDDTTSYKPNYTLKYTSVENPWSDLVRVTKVLNTLPLDQLEDSLNKVLDVDRALWFLAKEILFGDDDSYINKGGMDYYAIYQKDVERLIPLEYDANSVMSGQTSSWSIFLKENDTKFPLANRLFKVPSLRQRYLAHFRTLFNNALDSTYFVKSLNQLYAQIDSLVQSDPIKLMTYTAFQNEKTILINWMKSRRSFVLNNTEFKQTGNTISQVHLVTNGIIDQKPDENQLTTIRSNISGGSGVKRANLYYSPGYDGYFFKKEMFDDGLHEDELAGDGIYGAQVPGFPSGSFVRYYIESVAANSAGTATYMPEGAEHDVFVYQVNVNPSSEHLVVINEIMASNNISVRDQDGEYDDWIELYNNGLIPVDLSQYILTDNPANLDKYRIPEGTIMEPKSYLIIWADEDGKQSGLHSNFKLSSSGEELMLLDRNGYLVDKLSYNAINDDISYARRPNGTGNFVFQEHTFNANNDLISSNQNTEIKPKHIFPNPADQYVFASTDIPTPATYQIVNTMGVCIQKGYLNSKNAIPLQDIQSGLYHIVIGANIFKLLVLH